MTERCPALAFHVHLYSADVLAGFIMGSGGTRALHGLAADLDLVGCALAAGAGHAVEFVLVQTVDLDALARGAESADRAGLLRSACVLVCLVVVIGIPLCRCF